MILLAVSGAVLLFLLGYVVPRFAQVYAEMGDRLPPASRLFLALGQAISDHPQLMVAVLVAALAALAIAVRSQRARDSALSALQRIPSVRRILEAAQFARMYRTLALLVHGGIPLVSAMRIVRGLLSPEIAPRLDAALQAVSEGNSFSGAMRREGLATVIADRFMRVGEQTGRLGDMLDRAAEFHEDELGRLADRVGRVLGPVMMLLMGALIGFVVVMMYLPIFQLAEAVG
jgi:general secretion pathway protein F